MNKTLASLMTAACLLLLPLSGQALEYGKQKVVYHLNGDDPKVLMGAMRNAQNHINSVGAENVEIVVGMHGGGIALLQKAVTDENFRAAVDNLKMQNVKFLVSNNTLKAKKLDYHKDLYDVKADDIVPSGVAHLSYLQQQGFTYIKP